MRKTKLLNYFKLFFCVKFFIFLKIYTSNYSRQIVKSWEISQL